MKKILIFFIFLFSFNALANNMIKVAVIDSGFNLNYSKQIPLCKDLHKDFTGEGFSDIIGHGTYVTGLVATNVKLNYCIVLIKAYASVPKKQYITEALNYAYDINVNIINLSGGGIDPIEAERLAIKKLLNKKIVVIVAAGNDKMDLDNNCNYYPACYDARLFVIGNESKYSNYGKIVDTKYPDYRNLIVFNQNMHGTSQSTALFTNHLLKNLSKLRKN